MITFYDREGNPLTHEEYADLLNCTHHSGGKRVGRTQINRDVSVSTVWLGLNHGYEPDEIRIFETMIFGGDYEGWQEQYATEEQAMRGHLRVVDALRNGTFKEDE